MYKIWEFRKSVQTSDPWGANLLSKLEILTVVGLYSDTSALINVKFGTGGAERSQAVRSSRQISRLSGQCVAPAGLKPYFGLLSKKAQAWR